MTAQPTEKALFRINYNGVWFHDGDEIRRKALAKLFADKGLRIDEAGQYWLSSPVEKYRVEVEDVPFVIVDYDIRGRGEADQAIDLITNMGDVVPLDTDHGLILRTEPQGGAMVPYVEVRRGLYARLSRPVFYNLVESAVHDHDRMVLRSRKSDQILGYLTQDKAP